jgi:transcriptional regulator with XRE-family HTH domain
MPFSGEKLREIRERAGVEREALAAAVGTSKQYVSHLENGVKANPAFDLVEKLAKSLGVSLTAFTAEPPTMAHKPAKRTPRKSATPRKIASRTKG